MRDYPFVIPAGDSREEGAVGSFIYVKETSNPINVVAEFSGGVFNLTMERGDALEMPRGIQYNSFRIGGDGGLAATGVLVVGDGDFRREASITLAKAATSATGNISCLATASTVVRSAVSSRVKLRISSDIANSSVLKIAEVPSAANGIDLHPGETVSVTFTGVVRAYNPAGLAQQVSFFEERD